MTATPSQSGGPPAPGSTESNVVDRLAAAGLGMFRSAAAVMAGVLPGEAQTEWRELENKLHAFEWFSFAGPRLGLDPSEPAPLARPAARAAALADAYSGLWAMEGLGYACARATGEDLAPRTLLAGGRAGVPATDSALGGGSLAGLAARAAVPLSTGSALAAAERLLAEVDQEERKRETVEQWWRAGEGEAKDGTAQGRDRAAGAEGADRELVRRWLERCRGAGHPGFPELVAEALGLVARTLLPWRLPRLNQLLAAADPALVEYLWHGAGRGLYFAPMHLPPWSGGCRRAFAKAHSEPPHAAGRRNAAAGLAWALTLVNVRSPEVAEASLAGCGVDPDAGQAIANGASSALLVWRQWAGADRLLDRFLAYHPAGVDRARRWRQLVLEPCSAALAGSPADLRAEGRLAALFRFQVAS